jgi:hypothetical protein
MLGSKHLTHTTKKQEVTVPGMAHFAGTGPRNKCCGSCQFFGYWKRVINQAGNLVTSKRATGCGKFHALTGKHGPAINKSLSACKYFEPDAGHSTITS